MKHNTLEQGSMYHPKCDSCTETRPALKFYLDFDDPLRVIERHIKCDNFVWDFSIGLHGLHPALKKETSIVRACSAHANYHVHWWDYLYPRRDQVPKSYAVLDNEEKADHAYHDAVTYVIDDAFERRAQWRPGKR